MELVEGENLSGPLPLETALNYARQIADALEAAHEKGIVHRDLKPANVKVRPDGTVKVLDFGLAKAFHPEDSWSNLKQTDSPTWSAAPSQPGVILGTASYMSPEQARGAAVDKRADIWAFGAVLYEILTGKQAFAGETTSDILAAVLKEEPDWSRIPAKVQPLLRRCLVKDPKHRLRDIGDAMPLLDGVPEPAPARPPWPWVVGAVLAIALFVTSVLLYRATLLGTHPLVQVSANLPPGTRINRFRGAELALSPDGIHIVVAEQGDASGKWRLSMRSLDQSQFVPLSGTEGARMPFFSPDGQWIAFFADEKLKKLAVQGGEPVTLCDAPGFSRGASWGDDGNIVAAFSLGSAGLVRVSSGGGVQTAVTRLSKEKGETAHAWPQVLPGSQAVLFTAYGTGADDDAEIDAVSFKTGERKTLHSGGFFGRYLPSGHLVYLRQNTLWAAPFDLSRLEVTGAPQPVLEEVNGPINGRGDFDFSQTGTLVYVSSNAQISFPYSIWWLGGTGQTKALQVTPGLYESPRFSPDGKRLAFELATSPVRADIWVKDLERDNVSRLTHVPGRNNCPVWTPEGKSIVFVSTGQSAPGIYWIRADGSGEAQRLTDSTNISFCRPVARVHVPGSFSPDGKRLAYTQYGADIQGEIWTAPIEGDRDHPRLGKPEPFLRTSSSDRQPAFSPDGHWLAYSSNESGTYELYVRPFPGPGGKFQVSTGGGWYPIWSRDEHKLFFLTPDWRIMVAGYTATGDSFAAGKPQVWSQKSLIFLGGNYPYDLAPDGKRFAVVLNPGGTGEQEQRPTDSVTLRLNFFDELRRRVPAGGK